MTSTKRISVMLVLTGLSLLIGLQIATQEVAATYRYPAAFGGGLFDIRTVRIYPPWSFVSWYLGYERRFPEAFDLAGIVGLTVGLSPVLLIARLTRKTQRLPRAFGAQSWAELQDLRQAKLISSGGIYRGRILGRFKAKLLAYSGIEHAIIIGASRSGKGSGHVVPTLLSWPESAFIYDRKGELWHITADHRKTFSHVFYFAPTDPKTVRWNPLFEVRKGPMEIADIQNIVGILVDPLGRKAGDLNFWDQSATDFFTAVILHVLYCEPDEKKTLAHVRRLLIDIEPTLHAMRHTLHRHRSDPTSADGLASDADGRSVPEVHPEVLLGAKALASMEERVRSNVLATCRAALALWADPMVDYATGASDFLIGDLVCSEAPVSFYIVTPQAHADRLAFLVRVFIRQTVNSLMEHEHLDSRGRRKLHRLLLLLDEFPKLGGLPFLENALGEMAGYGITAHLICQSFNDVVGKYGENTSIFDNMHITAAFSTSEPKSIEKITRRAGKALEMRDSYSDPRTLFGRAHRSTSQSEQQRYILSEEDVRGLSDREQFLFVNGVRPIRADKIRYYEDPQLRERAGDYFHGASAAHEQAPGSADLPRTPLIAWYGVRAAKEAPEGFAGVSPPKPSSKPLSGALTATTEATAASPSFGSGEIICTHDDGSL